MMKTAEQLIQNAKSRIQEVSVNELFEAMQNHQPIAQPFLCQQHVHSIKQNRQFHQIDSSQYVIYSHKTSPLSFYHVMQFGLMIYDAEYVEFYKLAELLNQSINIVYLGLSSVPHVKRVKLIHAY